MKEGDPTLDESTSQLLKNAVGTFVRWLLILAAGVLVKKGIVSNEQAAIYVEQALPVVIGLVMALVVLVWGIWQKKHQVDKVEKALAAPAGTTLAELEQKV